MVSYGNRTEEELLQLDEVSSTYSTVSKLIDKLNSNV